MSHDTELYKFLAGVKSGAYTIKEAYDGILELGATPKAPTQHSEVERLVADPSWKVRLKALTSVNIDSEGGIYLRSIKDIYDLIEDALTTHSAKERESKDEAYRERNQLVRALTKLFPSYLARHDESDTTWERDWMWIVYIELPTGQVSWHIHDSERLDFSHLEVKANNWDGHNNERKYQRLAALAALPQTDVTKTP